MLVLSIMKLVVVYCTAHCLSLLQTQLTASVLDMFAFKRSLVQSKSEYQHIKESPTHSLEIKMLPTSYTHGTSRVQYVSAH